MKAKQKGESRLGTWETTPAMRRLEAELVVLQNLLKSLSAPRKWYEARLPIKDILAVANEVAQARATLWGNVYQTYPDTVGKTLSMGQKLIREV